MHVSVCVCVYAGKRVYMCVCVIYSQARPVSSSNNNGATSTSPLHTISTSQPGRAAQCC